MAREYTKEQIEQKVEDAVSEGKKLYNLSCINHQGCLKGSVEPTSDYIAKFLLGLFDYISLRFLESLALSKQIQSVSPYLFPKSILFLMTILP